MILIGRVSRNEAAWNARVKLAEALGALVITDLKVGASFPTDHPLHPAHPRCSPRMPKDWLRSRKADVILSLDWVDLAGTLKAARRGPPNAKVISVTVDHQNHKGWSMDHRAPPVDAIAQLDPADAVAAADRNDRRSGSSRC